MRPFSPKAVAWSVAGLLCLTAVLQALFTGSRSPEPAPVSTGPANAPSGAVAFVNGQPIAPEIWKQHAARRGSDDARAVLDDLIRQELLYQQAREAGYDRDPQLLASFRRMIVARFEEDQLARRASLPATSENARAYYDANQDKYRVAEKRRAAVILIRAPRMAQAGNRATLANRANVIREEALASRQGEAHFGALAARYSDDQATRYTGGDVGWLSEDEVAPRFGQALNRTLFTLANIGEVSAVIEVPEGFCFIRLVDKQPASVRRFEEVREALIYQLTQQRRHEDRREFEQQLRAGAHIQINEEALSAATVAEKRTDPKLPRMPAL